MKTLTRTMTIKSPEQHQRDTVLVVDDSPETLGMITDALEGLGVTVLVARDGHRALALLEHVTPDIVLMDAVMPGMDGFETCLRIKRRPALAGIPVIFMTGLSETEHVVRGMEAGGVDYVTKPVAPDELLARMRVHLANARLTSSARAALDATGRHMLAVDGEGRPLWRTPQAAQLLDEHEAETPDGAHSLREALTRSLQSADGKAVRLPSGARRLDIRLIGKVGAEEYLLSVSSSNTTPPEQRLQEAFKLTARQSEVLYWVVNGKSNREIGLILDMSPRTVNKHLELVYDKLGVDNRTSAAVAGLQVLENR